MGVVSLSFHGFAVDSCDRLYIGSDGEIRVFVDGILKKTIKKYTYRGYLFTIQNDIIIVSDSITVYEMDLQGNLLRQFDDEGSTVYRHLQHQKKFISLNGGEYSLRNILWRYKIA